MARREGIPWLDSRSHRLRVSRYQGSCQPVLRARLKKLQKPLDSRSIAIIVVLRGDPDTVKHHHKNMKYYLKRYGTHADTSDYTPDDHEREYVPTAYDDSSRHYDPSFGAMPNFELGGQSWVVNPANYHAPEVGQQDEWQGKTWRDMPGTDSDNKKLNFTLFRRGLYKIEEDRQWAAKRS